MPGTSPGKGFLEVKFGAKRSHEWLLNFPRTALRGTGERLICEDTMNTTQTVARLLAESLEAHDVDQIYCVLGESYVGFTSALIEKNSIRVIVCRHEAGAGYMAVADGRLRDRAGVAVVSRGPGLSNAMVSLHS